MLPTQGGLKSHADLLARHRLQVDSLEDAIDNLGILVLLLRGHCGDKSDMYRSEIQWGRKAVDWLQPFAISCYEIRVWAGHTRGRHYAGAGSLDVQGRSRRIGVVSQEVTMVYVEDAM